jgi:hypothetical protein
VAYWMARYGSAGKCGKHTAEIYCYAMLPTDFLTSSHHQLYWINDIVQMTKGLFLECRRIGLRLS